MAKRGSDSQVLEKLSAVLISSQPYDLMIERSFVAGLVDRPQAGINSRSLTELLAVDELDSALSPNKSFDKDSEKTQFLQLKNIDQPMVLEFKGSIDIVEIDRDNIFPLPILIAGFNQFPFIRALAQWHQSIICVVDPRYFNDKPKL